MGAAVSLTKPIEMKPRLATMRREKALFLCKSCKGDAPLDRNKPCKDCDGRGIVLR
jgi:DnaJ-class molecular chaperone